jgi:tRNA modification GTPase
MRPSVDTIAALATPPGASALALIRVSGPACAAVARGLFGLEASAPLQARRATYGRLRDTAGEALDDLIWTYAPGPSTATGEDTLELTPHGNPLLVHRILAALFAMGCRAAEPGEFTRRAYLHGKIDLAQAEAVMDLIHARSERALALARRQLDGELGRHLEQLIAQLLQVLARVEAYIDFPEEDLPAEDRAVVRAELENVLRGTGRLLATHRYGDLLRDGLKTVLLGAPNAGKSSLLNALVGRARALVSPEPGTTRDYLEERIQVGPHLLRMIDTAGLNPTPGDLERQGIAQTAAQLREADLVLWVTDASLPHPTLTPEFAAALRPETTLRVQNKADLVAAPATPESDTFPAIRVSALTGEGMDTLRAALVSLADRQSPALFAEEQLAINARHADALRRAEASLRAAQTGLDARHALPIELVAGELRAALEALGEIAGRIDHERMLDALFATFCIGK